MFVCFWLDGVQEGVISVDLRNAYDMRLGLGEFGIYQDV